jgi:hypothetical protein
VVVDDVTGGNNGGGKGLVVVSSVVVVVWLTGAGVVGPQPDNIAAPAINANASPWLKYGGRKINAVVILGSISCPARWRGYCPVVDRVVVWVIVCGGAGTAGTMVSVVSSSTSSLSRAHRRCEVATGVVTFSVVVVITGGGGGGVIVVTCSVDTVRVTGGGVGAHAAAARQAVSIKPLINPSLDLVSVIADSEMLIRRPMALRAKVNRNWTVDRMR